MSACPVVTSPIQRLNFDVLWRIFNINADVFDDDRALKTTLATSRVCHDWRSLMLSSSSIWAHVIDLDHRLWERHDGNREMIRRCGSALMWMKYTEFSIYLRFAKPALRVIDTNWERIERLEVGVSAILVDHWTSLYRPALHLKSFAIRLNQDHYKFDNLIPSLFFWKCAHAASFSLER